MGTKILSPKLLDNNERDKKEISFFNCQIDLYDWLLYNEIIFLHFRLSTTSERSKVHPQQSQQQPQTTDDHGEPQRHGPTTAITTADGWQLSSRGRRRHGKSAKTINGL